MRNKKLKAFVIGGVTVDHVFFNSNVSLKEEGIFGCEDKVDFENAIVSIGGGGSNVSTSLSRLGLAVSLCARIGDDFQGRQVREILEKENINLANLQVDTANATGIAFIAQNNGKPFIMAHRAANKRINIKNIDRSILANADLLYISSLSGIAIDDLPTLIKLAKTANPNVFVAINPGGSQLKENNIEALSKCLLMTDLLIVNKKESIVLSENLQLAGLYNDLVDVFNEESTLASQILKLGVKFLCITKDNEGSVLYSPLEVVSFMAMEAKYNNGLGAGDAFGSTLACSILQGYSTRESLFFASLNAASVVSKVDTRSGLLYSAQLFTVQ